jgi:hypothetical protein
MYHWIYTLKNLGLNEPSVSADYPVYNVFANAGAKTYVVYNYDGKPLAAKFSDGTTVKYSSKGLTVHKPKP